MELASPGRQVPTIPTKTGFRSEPASVLLHRFAYSFTRRRCDDRAAIQSTAGEGKLNG